jgi:hypothetical protein
MSLCLIKHHVMKIYRGSEGIAPLFLTSALNEVSHRGRFKPGKRAPGTQWIGSWFGPKASPNIVEDRSLAPDWNRTPVVQCMA